MLDKKPTVGEISKTGFKVDYSKLKKAILTCELNKDKNECHRILRELDIEVYDD